MKNHNILLTAEVDEVQIGEIYKLGRVTEAGWKKEHIKLEEDALLELLGDVDILITSYDQVTAKVIEKAPRLGLIACTRSGPVNIDIEAAKKKGVKVVYTPERNSDSTAEFAIALMLNISRNIPKAYRAILDGDIILDEPIAQKKDVTWSVVKGISPYVKFKGVQLKNKTLGIVGFGSIGKRVGRIAAGFGMNILVYDPYVSEITVDEPGQRKVDFNTLLKESDFITCHSKVTEQTKAMFAKKQFRMMKKSAFFINCSRGGVIQEEDLIEALRTKEIAGAALDVFENEPLHKGHPFVSGEIDNIVITPHIAGATIDSIVNHTKMVIGEVRRYINAEPLIYHLT
jgi:D-3-phosphoglycerate dehydrogenase / 2-oxoglutarate reductase